MTMHKTKLKNYHEQVKQVEKLRKAFEEKEEKLLKKFKNINDRVEYIINKLADFYKISADSWSYANCGFDNGYFEYDSDGHFETKMLLDNDFHVCVNFSDVDSYRNEDGSIISEIIINEGSYDPFCRGRVGPSEIKFPTRWIFEDFEPELEKSKILYELSRK